MGKRVYFRYNPATDSYERVSPRGASMWDIIRRAAEGLMVLLFALVIVYSLFDLGKEDQLRKENALLHEQLAEIDSRLEQSLSVMEDIAARDNNFYRVMLEADPLTDARRYAGVEAEAASDELTQLNDAALVKTVFNKLGMLERLIYTQSLSFDSLKTIALDRRDRIRHIPSIQPVSASALRQMASGYGRRLDPIYGTVKFHEGMDFASPVGTPVYATGDATVRSAEWASGYGYLVELDHGYNYVTRYAHLSEMNVKPGQKVGRGDLIGKVGNTGKSTGPHLHYEVRFKGVPQNPVNYYFQDLTPQQYAEMIKQAENAGRVMD